MDTSSLRERLAREVAGDVFAPAEPGAAAASAAFNAAVVHRPAAVVAARDAADVAAAVRIAGEAGLRVAVQATGHGAPASGEDTVLVSTRQLTGVTVDPVRRVARVAAGTRWREVIDAAVPHGLAPLSGSSSGVGAVGYTLGGGMGHLARRHGFAADHVRAVDLVTAAGDRTRVTAGSDPELFWALRGGQGGFGIATAIEIDLFPVHAFHGGAMIVTGPAVADVLQAFAAWAPTLPEHVTTSVALLRMPPVDDVPPPLRGVVSLAVRFGSTGTAEEADALLAPLRRVAGAPVLDSIGTMSFAAVDGIHLDPPDPLPAVFRGALLTGMPGDLVERLLAVAGPDVEVPLAMVELRLMGGALGRPAVVPNAVAGREGAFALSVVAPAPPPLAEVAPVVSDGVVAALAPWSTGTSLVNFAGHGAAAESIWRPDVLDRLRRAKAAADPRNLLGGPLADVAAGAR